jgi:tRNA uridine 5-carboxymethylaminomethyl modification enzyme
MAGINAAQKVRGGAPVVLPRSEAYIGIMIDDLVTQGTDEPYRMFTSRAEYRLHLRIDNADSRLTPSGCEIGLAQQDRREFFGQKSGQVASLISALRGTAKETWLRRPEVKIGDLGDWVRTVLGGEPLRGVLMTVETEVKYGGYLDQQRRQIERLRTSDSQRIPASIEFSCIPGISREVCERLVRVRPVTLGQAARIPGVTPAAIAILEIYLKLGVSRETLTAPVSRETSLRTPGELTTMLE